MKKELRNILIKCKNKDKEAINKFIEAFKPLIGKYKRKLYYEEAESDLIIFILDTMYKMPILDNDAIIVSYMQKAIYHEYTRLIDKSIKKKYEQTYIEIENIPNMINNNIIILKMDINKIPKLEKEIIIYKLYYDLTDKEISSILCISRQTVHKYKKRAFKTIKNYLKHT